MKRIQKIFLGLFLVAFTAFVFVACKDTTLEDAKAELAIGYQTPDTAESVTQNLTLPAKVGDVVVTWTSSDTAVITNTGTVTRQTEDKSVTLKATLSYQSKEAEKDFPVKVIARVDSTEAQAALVAKYAATLGSDAYVVTENVELVTTIAGFDVTWESNDPDHFSNTGVVTRPAFSEVEASSPGIGITLKASFVDGASKNFYFTVAKLDETVEEKIDKALNVVTAVPSSASGFQEINFAAVDTTEIDGEEVEVIWETSDAEAMTAEGVLVAFETPEEKEVKLTAKITYKDVLRTKEITFKLKAVTTFTGFEAALTADNVGKKIKIKDVSLYGAINGGFYITSTDNRLAYVYANLANSGVEAGKLYDVIAEVAQYYWTLQLTGASFSNPRDGSNAITPVEVSAADVLALPQPSKEFPNQHTLYKLTEVEVDVIDDTNYGTFLKPIGLTGTVSGANSILVYYQSNLATIKGLDGKQITSVLVINNGYRTDRSAWNINFVGTLDDIELKISDKEIVDTVASQLEASFRNHYNAATNLNLVTSQLGATIAWETSNANLVTTAGVLVLPASGNEEVELTATVTKGTESSQVVITFKVGVLDLSTIADVLTLEKGDIFKVSGYVTGISANNTYTITDSTGHLAVYVSGYRDSDNKVIPLEIGKVATFEATKDIFNGLHQGAPFGTVTYEDGVAPTPANLDEVSTWSPSTLLAYQSSLVSATGLIITQVTTDSYGNVSMTLSKGDNQVLLFKWDSRVIVADLSTELAKLKKGHTVNVVGAPLGWANNDALLGISATTQLVRVVPETDSAKVLEVANMLEIPLTISEAITLTLPTTSDYDATLSWVTSNADLITTAGVVNVPSKNAFVTLTVTIQVGAEVLVKEFVIEFTGGTDLVSQIKGEETGKAVTFYGVVTGIVASTYVYVSDADANAAVACYRPTLIPSGLKIGDIVTVTGTTGAYQGQFQITEATITIDDATNTSLPLADTLDTIPALTVADQAKLFSFNDLTVKSVSGQNLVVTDGTKDITARVELRDDTDLLNHIAQLKPGQKVSFDKVNIGWFNGAQLVLAEETQIVYTPLTGAELQEFIGAELLERYEGKVFESEAEIALSETSEVYGGTITWSTNPENAIVDGKFIVVTANTPVSLIASVVVGETAAKQFEFNVTLIPVFDDTLLYSENVEGHATLAYADTTTTLATLNWNIKQVYVGSKGDNSDLISAATDNLQMLRLRGANVAHIETAAAIAKVTRFVFDAKWYSSAHTTAQMVVYTSTDGTTWTEVEVIELTAAYKEYSVIINLENVYLKIGVTEKTANIDNIRIYG